MSRRIIAQRKGTGRPRFRAKSHRSKGRVKYPSLSPQSDKLQGQVVEVTSDPTRSAPLARVLLEDFSEILIIAPEGIAVGQWIEIGEDAPIHPGNVLPLGKIPEGTPVYNIEITPGDGGKLVRAGGAFAQVVSHEAKTTYLLLPSKKSLPIDSRSRATVGRIAGTGKREKPFTKAGFSYHQHKAKNRLYPRVSGVSMNPGEHPFGGGRHTGRSTLVSRNAPPGRKVGHIAAKRTGRRKR